MARACTHLPEDFRVAVIAAIFLFPLPHAGQNVSATDAAQKLEDRLKANPGDANAVRELHLLLAAPGDLTREHSLRLREMVRVRSREAVATLVAPHEPGQPLVISGAVRDAQGRPVQGALVTVFQTDAAGLYSKRDAITKRMDEPNSRIFGFLRTGPDGRYEFRTVRPGGYPFPLPGRTGDQAWVPEHIHLFVSAAGYETFGCGRQSCQIVFADDPRMTPHWQEWARTLQNPVLTLRPLAGGFRGGAFDISLRKEGQP